MTALPIVVELPVLGIRTRFATNSERVACTVRERYGCWNAIDESDVSDEPVVKVSIRVHERSEGDSPMQYSLPDATRVIAQSTGSLGMSDPLRGVSSVDVSSELVADAARFHDTMLEAMIFALLAHFDRHPLHASAVGADGHTLLLAGASGSGKSTLAHAAHACGLTVMAEDRVWVQLDPTPRVWGSSWPTRVRLAAVNGAKRATPLDGSLTRDRLLAERATVCVLEPGARSASIDRLTPSEVECALMRDVAPGFDRFPERHPRVARTLAAGGGWRLRLSRDPTEAMPLLRRALATA